MTCILWPEKGAFLVAVCMLEEVFDMTKGSTTFDLDLRWFFADVRVYVMCLSFASNAS